MFFFNFNSFNVTISQLKLGKFFHLPYNLCLTSSKLSLIQAEFQILGLNYFKYFWIKS